MFFGSWRLLALCMSVLAFSACDRDDVDVDANRMTSTEFVQRASASDMFEIQTGNLATNNAEMEEVKTFGAMLVNDHTESSNRLMALANQKNIAMSTTLPEDKRTIRDRLNGLNGAAFDQDFASVQVQAHQEAIDLYERAIEELQDAELRAFAQQGLPTLRMHLEMAENIRDMMD